MIIDPPNIIEVTKSINNVTTLENTVEVVSNPKIVTVDQPQNSVTVAAVGPQGPSGEVVAEPYQEMPIVCSAYGTEVPGGQGE